MFLGVGTLVKQSLQVQPGSVFLTKIISRRQKNADVKVVQSISRRQKWNSRRQFSKNCIFPNIQFKGFVNRLPPFKT